MKQYLKLVNANEHKKDLIFIQNNKNIGYFYIEIDGYWVYQPNDINGYWSAYILREIADKLDELNKDWDKQIKKEFSK